MRRRIATHFEANTISERGMNIMGDMRTFSHIRTFLFSKKNAERRYKKDMHTRFPIHEPLRSLAAGLTAASNTNDKIAAD